MASRLIFAFELFKLEDRLSSLEVCQLAGPGSEPKLQDRGKESLLLHERLCVNRLVDLGVAKRKYLLKFPFSLRKQAVAA